MPAVVQYHETLRNKIEHADPIEATFLPAGDQSGSAAYTSALKVLTFPRYLPIVASDVRAGVAMSGAESE